MWDPHSCRHSVDQPGRVHDKGEILPPGTPPRPQAQLSITSPRWAVDLLPSDVAVQKQAGDDVGQAVGDGRPSTETRAEPRRIRGESAVFVQLHHH